MCCYKTEISERTYQEAYDIDVLLKSGRILDFVKKMQAFLECVEEIFNKAHVNLTIDSINKLAKTIACKNVLQGAELLANLERTAVTSEKSMYDHVVYKSNIEKEFVQNQ